MFRRVLRGVVEGPEGPEIRLEDSGALLARSFQFAPVFWMPLEADGKLAIGDTSMRHD